MRDPEDEFDKALNRALWELIITFIVLLIFFVLVGIFIFQKEVLEYLWT